MRGAAALVVLCGCRGILGIHGLEDTPDARGPDSVSADTPGDTGTGVDGAGVCPAEFMQLAGSSHFYFLDTGPDTFNSMVNDCEALAPSTYLAIPDDQAELDALVAAAGADFWIGIDDIAIENTFVTVKGAPAVFLPWGVNQPNNQGGNEDCVEVVAGAGKLNDVACVTTLVAFCECEP